MNIEITTAVDDSGRTVQLCGCGAWLDPWGDHRRAGCPTKGFPELLDRALDLLSEAKALGLTFDRGNAYIRASYITKQDALKTRIAELVADSRAAGI